MVVEGHHLQLKTKDKKTKQNKTNKKTNKQTNKQTQANC